MHEFGKEKKEFPVFLVIIAALLVLFALLIGIGFFKTPFSGFGAREPALPQGLPSKTPWLALIRPSECLECFDLKPLSESIKSAYGINVSSSFEFSDSSDEGKALIKQLRIESLPTLVVFGSFQGSALEKEWLEFGVKDGNYLVLTKIPAPYYDLKSESIIGLVDATVIRKQDCSECFDCNKVISDIKEAGVALGSVEVLDFNSGRGKELLEKTGLQRLPLIIFSKSLSAYPSISQDWSFGPRLDDNSFVFSKAPYFDLKASEVKGLVGIVYLIDSNCPACYNPKEFHKPILENAFGMKFYNESTIDINSSVGIALAKKYNITAFPTVLLSKDASEYPEFVKSWKNAGTIEPDGVFVFRDFNSFSGKFKKLE